MTLGTTMKRLEKKKVAIKTGKQKEGESERKRQEQAGSSELQRKIEFYIKEENRERILKEKRGIINFLFY